jgi:Cu(I)/Ag(I) efflux system periplasmic protein CusF
MKTTPILAAVALALAALAPPTLAQTVDQGKAAAQQSLPLADAEVRRVDKDSGKVTLKHGVIKNLDMPPMTMVFTVRDKAMLDGIAAGDKVQFTAVSEKGQMLVDSIKRIQP